MIQHHTFWLPELCVTFTAIGTYSAAVKALESAHPGQIWRYTAVRIAKVRDLRSKAVNIAIDGLNNDARYWELRRTYGDASIQVLRHISNCSAVQNSR